MQDMESFTPFFPLTFTSWKIGQKGFHFQQIENISVDYYLGWKRSHKAQLGALYRIPKQRWVARYYAACLTAIGPKIIAVLLISYYILADTYCVI
jgi:hypothetical protein